MGRMETDRKKHYIVMTNRAKDPGLGVTRYICRFLEERGCGCTVFADNESADQIRLREAAQEEAASCMIVLGGDGTMLKAARETAESGIPLLGVNLGTVGYLAEVEPAALDSALEQLVRGDYTVEERMMLTARILRGEPLSAPLPKSETLVSLSKSEDSPASCTGKIQDTGALGAGNGQEMAIQALNDVSITRKGALQIIAFRVRVNGQILSSYGADGIVIATPTGSTGYNMSAGGPIVEPGADLILLTPICPHTLSARSIVLRPEDEVVVEIGVRTPGVIQEVEVSFDGSGLTTLRSGDRIRVTRSPGTTSIVKLSEAGFLERLHRKMDG